MEYDLEENLEITESKQLKKETESDLCIHKNTTVNNGIEICINCGIELLKEINLENEIHFYGSNDTRSISDPSRVHFRKIEDKNIYKDLEKYNLPLNIKDKTNIRYYQLVCDNIYRGNIRTGLIFACVFNIYKEYGLPKNKDELNLMFKISQKTIIKGLKMYGLL